MLFKVDPQMASIAGVNQMRQIGALRIMTQVGGCQDYNPTRPFCFLPVLFLTTPRSPGRFMQTALPHTLAPIFGPFANLRHDFFPVWGIDALSLHLRRSFHRARHFLQVTSFQERRLSQTPTPHSVEFLPTSEINMTLCTTFLFTSGSFSLDS